MKAADFQNIQRQGVGETSSRSSSSDMLLTSGEDVGDEFIVAEYGMKLARTGSYRLLRMDDDTDAVTCKDSFCVEPGTNDACSGPKGLRYGGIGGRARRVMGEAELALTSCGSEGGLTNAAGLRFAANDISFQRGGGWSVNGGGRIIRD
jgi:hypothetical protein